MTDKIDPNHIERIKKELIAAGVSKYGLLKAESRYLPQIIHANEHIGGVVYGRYKGGLAMLIATDQRTIFLDKKPMFVTMDELTYDVVSGVKYNRAGLVDTITLHTRVTDYIIRFVSEECAYKFVKFLESRRLENDDNKIQFKNKPSNSKANINFNEPFSLLNKEALKFMRSKDIAVLSSIDRTGNLYGSPVYFVIDQENNFYILTKDKTDKVKNISGNSQVALTIFEEYKAKTLSIQGIANYETDQKIIGYVFNEIVKPREYNGNVKLPPVTYIKDGDFKVIKITPTSAKYSDYSK